MKQELINFQYIRYTAGDIKILFTVNRLFLSAQFFFIVNRLLLSTQTHEKRVHHFCDLISPDN